MARSKVSPLFLTLNLMSCGGEPGASPTATQPTLPPVVIPTPAPTPLPANLQADTYCVPSPPPFFEFRVKIHDNRGWKKILDAKAIVGPDAAYCASQNQGGSVCVVRREDDPQAVTCTNLVSGKSDTGRYGPNWFYNDDTLCRPIGVGGNDAGCRLHETNQFLVYAFGPGKYTACHENAVCTDFEVK
jgi:hypothetical protein